ncbi:MAG: hypothetical protein V4736_08415 [Bdellovibrionota bacterium]
MKNHGLVKKSSGLLLLLIAVSAQAGNLQGNGKIPTAQEKALLRERSKLEILTRVNGDAALLANLQKQMADVKIASQAASVNSAAITEQMTDSTLLNRKIVGKELGLNLGLNSQDSIDFSNVIAQPSVAANYLSPLELASIYKPVLSAKGVKLGLPVTAGVLCPKETTLVYVDAKAQVIHIISNGFVLASREKLLDRAACTLAIPIEKAANRALGFERVDVHGLVAKLGSVTAVANVEAFVAGAVGKPVSQNLLPANAPINHVQRFLVKAGPSALAYGKGSTGLILRVNASLVVNAANNGSEGIAALDRISIKYYLK